MVEPAELHKVYPPADERIPGDRTATPYRAQIAEAAQISALRETADLMRAQLEDVRKDRDHWRDQAGGHQATRRRPHLCNPSTSSAALVEAPGG
jgi:hypothetical protein